MKLKRKTIQRSLIYETVTKLKCHATADQVYEAISKEHPSISRGTVYRNLNQLSDSKEIRKVEVPGGADRFDHQCFEHYHTKCLKCGQVFDVDMDYLTDLEKTIKNSQGFEFCGHDIMFQGICPECAKQTMSDIH